MNSQNRHPGTTRLRLILGLILFLLLLLLPSLLYATAEPANWLTSSELRLQKTADLAPNIAPPVRDTDCFSYTYVPKLPAGSDPRTICSFDTSLGIIGNGNELFTGPASTVPVQGIEGVSNTNLFLEPPGDQAQPITIPTATSLGNYLGFYTSLSRSALRMHGNGSNSYYTLKNPPDTWLRDDQQRPLVVNTGVAAYSADGAWMVTDLPDIGLSRIDLHTYTITPFAPTLEKPCSLAPSFAKLAISNDGRYVAVSPQAACQNPTEPSLELYDLSTCRGHIEGGRPVDATCLHKDVWNGGLANHLTAAQRPANLRFVNDQNLSFDVAYDYRSSNDFAVGSFLATVGATSPHLLGLLGIGDSFMSGEGSFDYRAGTDTSANSCHLSFLSYSYILGKDDFDSTDSAACSGATTEDLNDANGAYSGQVSDGVAQKDRNVSDILSRFLPGYVNQDRFVEKYQPEAILLSIGGNDIGFADIVKRCATPSRTEPVCYDTYEDRADLVNLINSNYFHLISTFTSLRRQSPASRIYVVGYPQIVKAGGDCAANVQLSSKEVLFANDLVSYLNDVIRQASSAAGVSYIDSEQAFDGYRLCEGRGSNFAVNGLTAGRDDGVSVAGHSIKIIGHESYHPTALGYRLLAAAVARQTNNLQLPLPVPQPNLRPPGLSPSLAILQNVPRSGRPLKIISVAHPISPVVTAGSGQSLQLSGKNQALQPGGQYSVTLADSTPIATAIADSDGNLKLQITVSPQAEPGYQLLHITGTNTGGDSIDIQQTVYVALSDAVQADTNCSVVPDSHQDFDSDGIDDACDPVIGSPPIRSYPVTVKLITNSITFGRP